MSRSVRKRGRKKSSDRQNRKDLYEKHIPCISGAIASIVDKTRNYAFKMHCHELLQVADSSNTIQDAISSKLFMLTLGNNSESTSYSQEDQNKLHTTSTTVCGEDETAFADLANHLENDIASAEWSFLGAAPPCPENTSERLLQTNAGSTRAHDTAQETNHERSQNKENIRLESMRETENQKSLRKTTKAFYHAEADIATPDDDFESLEDDMIFSEFPATACDVIGENRDQRVPCYEQQIGSVELTTCRAVIPERMAEIVSGTVNDDRHFETLGIFM